MIRQKKFSFQLATRHEVVVGIVEVLDGLGDVLAIKVSLVGIEFLMENLHDAE